MTLTADGVTLKAAALEGLTKQPVLLKSIALEPDGEDVKVVICLQPEKRMFAKDGEQMTEQQRAAILRASRKIQQARWAPSTEHAAAEGSQ